MRRVTVLLAVTLLGCAPSTPEVPGVPTESATITQVPQTMTAWPSQSPTPTKSPEQQAAEAVVAEYFRLKNEIKQDPTKDMEPLRAIVTGDTLAGELALLEQDRENRVVQKGSFLYVIRDSTATNATKVTVRACTDASQMDMLDEKTGESVLDPDRPFVKEWTVETSMNPDGGWQVSNIATENGSQCAE